MKKIFTTAVIILLTISATQAQSTTQPVAPSAQEHHKALSGLNLSADQKTKMKEAKEAFKLKAESLKKDNSLSGAERKSRMEILHKEYKVQADAILTPEQKEKFADSKEDRKATNMQKGAKGNRAGKRGHDHFTSELNLTADQQTKVTNIRNEYKSKFEALRDDRSLSQDAKQTRMKELRKEQNDQMKTVLTKEQITRMQSLKKERTPKVTK